MATDGVERYRAQVRLNRLICLGGAVLFVGLGLYFIASAALGTASNKLGLVAAAFALFMAVILAIGSLWKWSPGATEVSVDASGVHFRYANGRTRQVLWSGEGFPVTIQRTDGVDDEISRGHPVQAVSGRLWLQDFLSPETYHEMVTMARSRGISVVESPGLRPGWIRVTLSVG